jgi:hypothetical protein
MNPPSYSFPLTPVYEEDTSENSFHDQLFDREFYQDYENALSTSQYCQVEEEKSFPHLMPILEGYKRDVADRRDVVYESASSRTDSLSSLTNSLHSAQSSPSLSQSSIPPLRLSTSLPSIPTSSFQSSTTPSPHFGSSLSDRSRAHSLSESEHLIDNSNPLRAFRHHRSFGSVGRSVYDNFQDYNMISKGTGVDPINHHSESDDLEEDSEDPDSDEEINDGQKKRRSAISELPVQEQQKKISTIQPKKRQRTSPEQLEILETVYQTEKLPGSDLRKELAVKLKMTPRRVQVWFQNKRAKEKRMGAVK